MQHTIIAAFGMANCRNHIKTNDWNGWINKYWLSRINRAPHDRVSACMEFETVEFWAKILNMNSLNWIQQYTCCNPTNLAIQAPTLTLGEPTISQLIHSKIRETKDNTNKIINCEL